MKKKAIIFLMGAACTSLVAGNALADVQSPITYGNGTWIYDGQYSTTGEKTKTIAGFFLKNIHDYNQDAGATHQLTQLFPYGGDLEYYPDDQSPQSPNDFLLVFYPINVANKNGNTWTKFWSMGDSGFTSTEKYKAITTQDGKPVQIIADIDGRVDIQDKDSDYLNELNKLGPKDAQNFADKVAKGICADDSLTGVQFDIEPFSFTGGDSATTPPYKGDGQKYFYTEIAKDFAGYYGNAADPAGINPSLTSDPLHCVDKANPNGRSFSVFTFAEKVTPDVAKTFTHHNNGYIVDSLYDLGNTPGGTCTMPDTFQTLAQKEVTAMENTARQYGLPYQFAIPAAAGAHEYETKYDPLSGDMTTCAGVGNQYEYVKYALSIIKPAALRANDPNFKGIDVWSWNSAMWWGGMQFTPAIPEGKAIEVLQAGL